MLKYFKMLTQIGVFYFLRIAKHVETYFSFRFNWGLMTSFSPSALAHPPAIVNIDSTTFRGGGEWNRARKAPFPYDIYPSPTLSKSCLNLYFTDHCLSMAAFLCILLTHVSTQAFPVPSSLLPSQKCQISGCSSSIASGLGCKLQASLACTGLRLLMDPLPLVSLAGTSSVLTMLLPLW